MFKQYVTHQYVTLQTVQLQNICSNSITVCYATVCYITNGTALQNGTGLQNGTWYKMIHYYMVQLQNGTCNNTELVTKRYTVLKLHVTEHYLI
jgi:hypothetical protein